MHEIDTNIKRTERGARSRKNPQIFSDEYVTSVNGKRKTPNIEFEDRSDVISSTSQNRFIRKRENKTEQKKNDWTYQEVSDLTKHFMSFEWDNREVQRYNLCQNLTANIFWHLVSNQFFPLNTFDIAQNFEEYFDEEIRQKYLNHDIKEKEFLSLYNVIR
jgi:hypothetical protein